MRKCFTRLAEVPQSGYEGSPVVDRTRLPGFDLKPRVDRYEWDGKVRESLMWPMKGGSTSASPASQLESTLLPGETQARTALRHCHEALELPGTLSDYHFIIQGAHEAIWKYRRSEPWVVEETERLCRLDLRLIQAHPESITFDDPDRGEGPRYPRVMAFQRLISLYETEGCLREALEVARIAVRFDQFPRELERLEEKVKALDAEAGEVN